MAKKTQKKEREFAMNEKKLKKDHVIRPVQDSIYVKRSKSHVHVSGMTQGVPFAVHHTFDPLDIPKKKQWIVQTMISTVQNSMNSQAQFGFAPSSDTHTPEEMEEIAQKLETIKYPIIKINKVIKHI